MADSKRKWEVEYGKYSSMNIDEEIKKLENNAQELSTTRAEGSNRDEYEKNKIKHDRAVNKAQKKVEKMKQIKANMPNLANILELKKELVKNTNKLLKEKNEISKLENSVKKADEELKKLDTEREKQTTRLNEIEKEMKSCNSEEDRNRLKEEKQQCLGNILQNDLDYQQFANEKDKNNTKLEQYKGKKTELKAQLLKNEQLIGKCDLIGEGLIAGKNMEDIKVSLDSYKFKPDKEFAKKIQETREMYSKEKNAKENQNPQETQTKETSEQEKQTNETVEQETQQSEEQTHQEVQVPIVKSESKLKRMMNAIKNKFSEIKEKIGSILHRNTDKQATQEQTTQEQTTQEQVAQEQATQEQTTQEQVAQEQATQEQTTQERVAQEQATQEQTENKPKTKADFEFEYAMKQLDGENTNGALIGLTENGIEGFRKSIRIERKENISADKKAEYEKMKQEAEARTTARYKDDRKKVEEIKKRQNGDEGR